MISFNVPTLYGEELKYIENAVNSHKISGDGYYTLQCSKWLETRFNIQKVLLTTSGSAALEMAAFLCDLNPGDEVILPSYTFSSTANAFVLAGARLVFVDIRPDTMNIDENKIETAITPRTKAICVVHYAGVACEMDKIMDIARRYKLLVVEDAAQAIMGAYKGRPLGTIGDFGCFSFHETKNFSMGEGGALLINNPKDNLRAEILREKGTNRSQFFRGQVAKYNWLDFGSSYLPSDINAAYLYCQLEHANEIQASRMSCWNAYNDAFNEIRNSGIIELPQVPEHCVHNAHMYYIKCINLDTRTEYIKYMQEKEIQCVFHYVPLHSSPAGQKFGRFDGIDTCTSFESDRLVRLPLYYNLSPEDQSMVITRTLEFFKNQTS